MTGKPVRINFGVRKPWLIALAVAVIILIASGSVLALDRAGKDTERDSSEMKTVPAPIESVDISIAESSPPQYFLRVVSGLPDGCTQFDRYVLERSGKVITVTVTNTRPAADGIACTAIYGYHTSNIPLGSDFRSGEIYTVVVNDVTKSFTAQ